MNVILDDMDMSDTRRSEAIVGDHEIVLIYNGLHYNVLTLSKALDNIDDDDLEHDHFEGSYDD